ncbi:hypothetical protein OUZ56_018390 [Daphnia magna]|uniref:Uncharacterized protein n=1 Tax=Daphnia magna TaxID=35525 RepID=A0ABQ9Z8P6_9CRUS|nr:hypothetical protein OUZ56_018390 [Daphnia magna]
MELLCEAVKTAGTEIPNHQHGRTRVPVRDENDCESSDGNEEPLSDDEADFGENIDNCDAKEIDDSTVDDSIAMN